jgi:hypothetical protein
VSEASLFLLNIVEVFNKQACIWGQNNFKNFIISNLGLEIDGKLREKRCNSPDLHNLMAKVHIKVEALLDNNMIKYNHCIVL